MTPTPVETTTDADLLAAYQRVLIEGDPYTLPITGLDCRLRLFGPAATAVLDGEMQNDLREAIVHFLSAQQPALSPLATPQQQDAYEQRRLENFKRNMPAMAELFKQAMVFPKVADKADLANGVFAVSMFPDGDIQFVCNLLYTEAKARDPFRPGYRAPEDVGTDAA